MNFKVYDWILTAANLFTVSTGIEENIQSIYGKINEQKNAKY